MIVTLDEANVEIERLIIQNKKQALTGLLSNCQNFVEQIGGFIKWIEGKGTNTVLLLEEYREFLCQMSAEINKTGDEGNFVKKLEKSLTEIENSARTELKPNKIEVVFITWRAMQFDALESVYLAALQYPMCDAYVVTAPYYEINPDKTLGKMYYEGQEHYEAPLYQPNIKTTDWQDYDVAARHPDMIFVNNPYDDSANNARIHPDFNCERLRNCTDLLIYIPYFVVTDDVPEHFVITPGCIYAHHVIVQSEKVRDTYIRIFKEASDNRIANLDEKFLALGSPKFDKVINTKREDVVIPDVWQRLIHKADKIRKKVILYNTHMFTWMDGGDVYFKKLHYVFDFFRNRDDVVLLWRPHPNTEVNFRTMRPGLLDKYTRIVAEYKRESWGIYDDTPDLHRAIAWSDAYFGDWSSLVSMYQVTGKPVLLQNERLTPDNTSQYAVAFENLYDDGDYFWCTAWDFNALFRIEKQSWHTEYVGSFPGEQTDGSRLFREIVELNGKLYFTPFSAASIGIYDKENGTFGSVPVDCKVGNKCSWYNKNAKFTCAVVREDKILFLPYCFGALLAFDVETGETRYTEGFPGFWNAIVAGNKVLAARCGWNFIDEIDLETWTDTPRKLNDIGGNLSSFCSDGQALWLPAYNDDVFTKYNWETGETVEYRNFPDAYQRRGYAGQSTPCYAGGYVWFFPASGNMGLKIDVANGNMSAAEAFQPEFERDPSNAGGGIPISYILSVASGDTIYAHTGKSNRFISYNTKTGERREEEIRITPESWRRMAPLRTQAFFKDTNICETEQDCFYHENAIVTLKHYVSYIQRDGQKEDEFARRDKAVEIFRKTNAHAKGTAGQAIYDFARKSILG
jgi:hypothetical protein